MRRMAGDDVGDHRLHSLLVTDVGGGAFGLAAILRDFGDNFVKLRVPAANHHDGCAKARQFMRRTAPYPTAASGDNVDLPFEEDWTENTAIALAPAHAESVP